MFILLYRYHVPSGQSIHFQIVYLSIINLVAAYNQLLIRYSNFWCPFFTSGEWSLFDHEQSASALWTCLYHCVLSFSLKLHLVKRCSFSLYLEIHSVSMIVILYKYVVVCVGVIRKCAKEKNRNKKKSSA